MRKFETKRKRKPRGTSPLTISIATLIQYIAMGTISAAVSWGVYLTYQVDSVKKTNRDQDVQIAVNDTNYKNIDKSLTEIKTQLNVLILQKEGVGK